MFSTLYPIAWCAATIALTGWFFFKENEAKAALFRTIFFPAILVFFVSLLLAQGSMAYKMQSFGREMLLLAFLPVILSVFKKNKIAYVAMLVLSTFLLNKFYFGPLFQTFPQSEQANEVVETSSPMEGADNFDPAGELLIELKEKVQLADIQDALKKYNLTAERAFYPKDEDFTELDDYFVINVPDNLRNKMGEVVAALQKTGVVEWVEGNEIINLGPETSVAPTQLPDLKSKYGLNDVGLNQMWGFEAMKINDLFDILKNKKPVKKALIAILDTGVDANHEDLNANFKSIDSKYDSDKAGHGTHCAGISAAVSNNGKGVASFSQTNDYVQVTSVKVLSDWGSGSQKSIIDGILTAADAGADVLSLSLGGPSFDPKQKAYTDAVKYANKKGGIVVVAAGNSKADAKNYSPANVDGVITVSAIDTALNRASFSNFVQNVKWGVAAPGVKIYSTLPGNKYEYMNGTSMATPYVAGLVGLLKSLKPGLKTDEVFDILNKSGAETGNTKETGKLIRPAEAVRLVRG